MRIAAILLVFLFFACKKAEDRACVKFHGKATELVVDLSSHNRLYLGPYLDYVLVQDTLNYVKISGGENVVHFIETEIVASELRILNKNKCRFLRKGSKKITVEIHFVQLENIFFEGSGNLISQGVLYLPDLELVLNEGSGTVDLQVESNLLRVSAEPSWSNYKLSGHCVRADLTVKGNAYANTTNLFVDSVLTVKSRSSADIKVNATSTVLLKCETMSNGNIYYTGSPETVIWNDFGNGQLIQE